MKAINFKVGKDGLLLKYWLSGYVAVVNALLLLVILKILKVPLGGEGGGELGGLRN